MSEQNKNNNENNNNNKNNRKKREFILNKDVDAQSVENILMEIIEINRIDSEKEKEDENYVREPIKVIVNSYGGVCHDGIALAGVIDSSETPVYTYIYGKAMSMGFYIFASGHRRFAHPMATFMFHDTAFGIHAKTQGVEEYLKQAISLRTRMNEFLLSVTNLPKEKMEEAIKYQIDWYLTPHEAIEYGLADELIKSTRNRNK
ncbi:ATP-dependent Clp protease proteolytic subunit [Halobacillus rhizosphaerae]|uniref:ATP-dependent Clp protease proteolytic subunit n=1 Tax=Halobacillus rhizosphaerae TaxID=3064889 RepID=UPI00398B7971